LLAGGLPSRRAELGHHVVFSIALVDAKHERAKARLSVDHHADGVPTVGTIPCLVTAMNLCEVRA